MTLEPLVKKLLRGVAIFDDLEAHGLRKKLIPTWPVRPLAGEFVSSEGIVFGGSSTTHKESLLERKSRIAALTHEHAMSRSPSGSRFSKNHAAADAEMEAADAKPGRSPRKLIAPPSWRNRPLPHASPCLSAKPILPERGWKISKTSNRLCISKSSSADERIASLQDKA